jgi:hypothetical protein
MSDDAQVATNSPGRWWSWRLLGLWIAVNAGAYVVVVGLGVSLDELLSGTFDFAQNHKWLAVLILALIGGAVQGVVLGVLQWRILRLRMPGLQRRRWVTATFAPSLIIWLLSIAPRLVDTMVSGGDTLDAFKNGFVQALVLGPLIGLAQAMALRDDTTRWKWWFVANVTTWLVGAALYEVAKWLLDALSLPEGIAPAFPLLGFVFHGIWMLWVSAPEATAHVPPSRKRKRQRRAHPATAT